MARQPASSAGASELVFLPLGGVGEIGMNLGLYGLGPPGDRTWLAIDFGIGFAGPDLPGVDVIYPDISFLEKRRGKLAGIVITHAHEDHYGALLDLWPRLGVPVYATAFTAGLLAAKRAGEPSAPDIPVTVVGPGQRFSVGPFDLEMIAVTHSIPEPTSLAIRTPHGTVLHSGDWKLDPEPVVGPVTDADRLRAIGAEGVLALVCDSTNAMREGRSPSEREVADELAAIVAEATGRVVFTLFSSNVARIRAVALAAAAAGREVVLLGRALRRMVDVARELGYLDGVPQFYDADLFERLPRNRIVALATGSQGEPRAAMSRMASGDYGQAKLAPGDLVVFSSRPIPGNERAINGIINGLVSAGIHVITDRDRLVHVSGHPRRDELADLYGWVKPQISVPVHGEAQHLAAHAALARSFGVPKVLLAGNGRMTRLAPDPEAAIEEVGAGRIYRDGTLIGGIDAIGVKERRRLGFAGHVAVAVVLDAKGEILSDPDVILSGLPEIDAGGRLFEDLVAKAANDALDALPRARRRDPDLVEEAVRRAVRAVVRDGWGKKPVCSVMVTVL